MLLLKDFFFCTEWMSNWQSRGLVLISCKYSSINCFMSDSCLTIGHLSLPFPCLLSCVSAFLLTCAMGTPFCCSYFMHGFCLVLDVLHFTVLPSSASPDAWKSTGSKYTFMLLLRLLCFNYCPVHIALLLWWWAPQRSLLLWRIPRSWEVLQLRWTES